MLYFQIGRPGLDLVPDQRNKIYSVRKRAQEVAKSEDKWDIFINTLSLGLKGNKDGVIDDKEMVAFSSNQSRFPSNKIQQERTEKRLANLGRTPEHFTFEKVHRRLQNIDTSKIPSMQDLADVIVMLSMRPAEVLSFQIINYKPDSEDLPAWYKAGYSWYCTGCHKQRDKQMPMRLLSMEKDPEHARKLLTWIQDAIKAGKLRDPVYTETGKCDPKSKKEPKSEPETGDGLNPQTQASSPASQSRNNDPKKSQTMDMDSMLAEIDAMLAEIRK
ncbi:hypothetical protein GLOIN_2v1477332 [Rhizophagus irregularis DAOM 181602=DAOM 197198]|nr:hypothetical protein GLOIN_2v1477332 [Rhizophagus irregularis DAOM 181602=DAOM 197198]